LPRTFEPFIAEEQAPEPTAIKALLVDDEELMDMTVANADPQIDVSVIETLVTEQAELFVESKTDGDGNVVISIIDIGNEETVLNVVYSGNTVLVDVSALEITDMESYDYIAIDADGKLLDSIFGDAMELAKNLIDDDNNLSVEGKVYDATGDMSVQVWELIENLMDLAVSDDDFSWTYTETWDIESDSFNLSDYPDMSEATMDGFKITSLLSNWAVHETHLRQIEKYADDEAILARLRYFCLCEEIGMTEQIPHYEWLWDDENTEFRQQHFDMYDELKLGALNAMANRGIITRDFARAMFYFIRWEHQTNRNVAERIIEVFETEIELDLLLTINEHLGLDFGAEHFIYLDDDDDEDAEFRG